MPEKCPLLTNIFGIPFIDTNIPDFCREACEGLWNKAASEGKPVGIYDRYDNTDLETAGECQHNGGIGFSHDALVAINEKLRQYIIVDMCEECETEYGEQGYEFRCPKV